MGTGLLGVAGALGLDPWQLGASARSVGTRPLGPSRTRLRLDWRTLAVNLSAAAMCSARSGELQKCQGCPVTPKSSKTKLELRLNSRSLTEPVWKRA